MVTIAQLGFTWPLQLRCGTCITFRGCCVAITIIGSSHVGFLCAQIFKRIGVPAVKLLLIPGLVEAFFNGGLAVALFDVSALFGFALGFILKAIGPALVIQLMFELQQKRLGTAKSEPPHPLIRNWHGTGTAARCLFNLLFSTWCEVQHRSHTLRVLWVVGFFRRSQLAVLLAGTDPAVHMFTRFTR